LATVFHVQNEGDANGLPRSAGSLSAGDKLVCVRLRQRTDAASPRQLWTICTPKKKPSYPTLGGTESDIYGQQTR
jgi:hypothetical protein